MNHRQNAADRQNGFVLVTSLLVMVVLAGLGAGAFFLSNMNLRIAENTRTAAVAHYNAHEGLDVALLILAKEYHLRGDGTWPTYAELVARTPAGAEYEFVSLDYDPANAHGLNEAGTVTVRGFGPRNAQYETGARFRGEVTTVPVEGESDPLFGTGWVTDSKIQINGNTSFSIPLWAGASLTANSTKVLGTVGNFANSGFVGGNPAGCTIHGHSAVTCNRGQTPPVVPLFVFEDRLAELTDQAPMPCSVTLANGEYRELSANSYQNATICLGENSSLRLTGTASNTYVLGPRTSSVDLRGSSTPYGGPDGVGIKVAAGTITFTNNPQLAGTNTLFSATNLLIPSASSAVISGGIVATLFGTEGGIKLAQNGGNDGGRVLNAILWANGSVCKQGNGGLSFTGTVLAKGLDNTLGNPCELGIYWNGGGGGSFTGVANADIPDTGGEGNNPFAAAGIRVLARRP